MRSRTNMASIAVLLAFQGWMFFVVGMMLPSGVAAQDTGDPAAAVALQVANAPASDIFSIVSTAVASQPTAVDRIVERSVVARPAFAELVVNAAVKERPTEASRITGAAMRGLYESGASQTPAAQTASQEPEQSPSSANKRFGWRNNPRSPFGPFNPFDPDEFRELLASICQVLGRFGVAGQFDFCVSPAV
jgi:hypothetical protein